VTAITRSALNYGLVLAYHSHHVVGDEYGLNDHLALAEDLELITTAGYRIVPIVDFVDSWGRWSRASGGVPQATQLIALTFDDGPVYDVADFVHPEFGQQRSFLNILRDFQAKHAGNVQPDLHATSFVIASPEARSVMERTFDADYTYLGPQSMGDEWWTPAIETGMIGIANHSWDHLHPALRTVAHSRQVRADFRQVVTLEDANAQIAAASAFIAQRTGGKASPFFAYPFGHYNDFLVSSYFPQHATSGVRAAFSIDPRPVVGQDSIWCLPRYVCGDNWRSPDELWRILRESITTEGI
jgi:peptidoglycan/xylan/chitin deacetylase (PgdA/CDA1 family)